MVSRQASGNLLGTKNKKFFGKPFEDSDPDENIVGVVTFHRLQRYTEKLFIGYCYTKKQHIIAYTYTCINAENDEYQENNQNHFQA